MKIQCTQLVAFREPSWVPAKTTDDMKLTTPRSTMLWVRIKTAYKILFRSYKHWTFISIDTPELKNLISDKPVNAFILTHGIHKYLAQKLLINIALSKDEIDMALSKAEFEADAELFFEEEQRRKGK